MRSNSADTNKMLLEGPTALLVYIIQASKFAEWDTTELGRELKLLKGISRLNNEHVSCAEQYKVAKNDLGM